MTDEGMNTTMLVSPNGMGNGFGNGFGGDGWWIILLILLFAGNGWGGNGNGFGGGNIYPWMNQANLTSEGFQNQLMNDNITSIRDGVHGISNQLCNGFAGVEQGANARQMANMQSIFGLQSQMAECCCENRAGIADLKYTVATENCADRTAAYQNTRDIIDSQTRGTQAILDKLCQLELDGVKAQVEAKNDRISELQTQLNMANLAASQIRQTADIQNNIVNELRSCPIPAQPVYGSQPIFSCPQNSGCGCGQF